MGGVVGPVVNSVVNSVVGAIGVVSNSAVVSQSVAWVVPVVEYNSSFPKQHSNFLAVVKTEGCL